MAQESMMNRADRAQMAQKRLFVKRYSIQQYKTPKIRPESSRAGLSYTVASRAKVYILLPPMEDIGKSLGSAL